MNIDPNNPYNATGQYKNGKFVPFEYDAKGNVKKPKKTTSSTSSNKKSIKDDKEG